MIPTPKHPRIISSDANTAILEIEGLFPGYGITLGNALRRALLSSCEGAAVTSFRIEGVHHEFSTIPGVLEDAIELSLNLKRLRLKIFSDEPQTLSLSVKGERTVAARDIEKNSQVEIANPDLHIATLTDKHAVIDMKLIVEKGMGYSQVEQRKKEKLPIGTIALDANFSPVTLVNFEVENMMVEGRADYNRLRLSIETDGTLDPLVAYGNALEILVSQFQHVSLQDEPSDAESSFSALREELDTSEAALDDTGLSARIVAALSKNGVKTVGDLAQMTKAQLSEIKGFGEKAVEDIARAAKKYGITIK